MTAVSAEENSLSSKRSWNLTAELSPTCLSAGGAESALGPIKAAPWRLPFHGRAFLVAAMGSVLRSGATSRPYSPSGSNPFGRRSGLSAVPALQRGHGAPAPPQPHACEFVGQIDRFERKADRQQLSWHAGTGANATPQIRNGPRGGRGHAEAASASTSLG
jgi:hypothetical protein